jgi:hypothetical protein
MKALDRLKASTSMKPTPRTVTLPNGDVFEFLSRPVTLAQRARAQKQAGNDSASDFALQLLVMLAEDENGQKLFDAGDIAELRNALPASVVENLMLQLISEPEGEEDFDPKPSGSSLKKTTS